MEPKFDIIVGAWGSKMDFIAGWLGTLSEYNNSSWEISDRGVSKHNFYTFKDMDYESNNLNHYFNMINSPILDLSKRIAFGIHGFKLINQVNVPNARVIVIYFQKSDLEELVWNTACKNNYHDDYEMFHCHLNWKNSNFTDLVHKFKAIIVDYSKFNHENGSRYIQEKLKINVSELDHLRWKTMFPKSIPPNKFFHEKSQRWIHKEEVLKKLNDY